MVDILKDLKGLNLLIKQLERRARLNQIVEERDSEERDKWLLGLAGKAPPDLIEAYSRLTMARDSFAQESPEMWHTLNLFVQDLQRRLDSYYDLSIRRYNQKLMEILATEVDPMGGLLGLPEGEIFAEGKKKGKEEFRIREPREEVEKGEEEKERGEGSEK